jgi:hypothetical protein
MFVQLIVPLIDPTRINSRPRKPLFDTICIHIVSSRCRQVTNGHFTFPAFVFHVLSLLVDRSIPSRAALLTGTRCKKLSLPPTHTAESLYVSRRRSDPTPVQVIYSGHDIRRRP